MTRLKKPTRNFSEYFWTLKNVHNYYPDACIDVGAGYGTASIYRSFENSHHIVIEPLKGLLSELQQCLGQVSHTVYNCGVLECARTEVIRKPENLLNSSFAHSGAGGAEYEAVEVTTLDSLMDAHREYTNVLLKTDCQGTDYEVLQGASQTLSRCNVIGQTRPL